MKIIVSPLNAVEVLVAEENPTHVLSFTDPAGTLTRPLGIAKDNHLLLRMNDIAETQHGLQEPRPEHIEKILNFLTKWNGGSTILIHCLMGVSRSSAAAYIALCMHRPHKEKEIIDYLRKKGPHVQPNVLMVTFADHLLGREGRMINAVRSLPPGNLTTMGTPFDVNLDLE